MNAAIILSVMHSGTHFMKHTLNWLGVSYENFHPGVTGGWRATKTVAAIPEGIKVAPLRDPLLSWITYIQRANNPYWKRNLERGHPISFDPLMGRNGKRAAWEWLFQQDIAAFVPIDLPDQRRTILGKLIKVLQVPIPKNFDEYIANWPKSGSQGDLHELKAAYVNRDKTELAVLIEQVRPLIPLFESQGYKFWWQ